MRKLTIGATWSIFAVLILLPLGYVMFAAFSEGWSGFYEAITRPEAKHAFKISFIIVVISTVLNVVVGVFLALELVRGRWLARWLKPVMNAIVDLPFAVSPVIGGLMIILLFGPETILGAFFDSLGYKIVFALPGMVMATLFVTFPFVVREIVPVLQEIGTEAEEASAMLGASSTRTFWRITFPAIKWAVVYGAVLTIARSLGEFGAVLVVSGNIMNETQTATTLVYQDADNFNLVGANAIALVLGLISVMILLFLEWLKHRREVLIHGHSG
ncbi:sulfate ABC transporter permease subunit [Xylanibacillus composti]|uniref:Sulfate ABC transporter permease subunit CysW n=1 Tax=Xylanibacillus composti TaxID=1572762 RepID=A0A8J4H6E0_9BACL|nr:sulfate ABC transporter permease subunit [Xylanibacillus composti]MDT9726977.1 sulfate ABC transporter permease subunit [Xylanibacillus composti]GIQ69533.1 sulfate ABC transporter permease subunit CysW [Xylanibacillus composti]